MTTAQNNRLNEILQKKIQQVQQAETEGRWQTKTIEQETEFLILVKTLIQENDKKTGPTIEPKTFPVKANISENIYLPPVKNLSDYRKSDVFSISIYLKAQLHQMLSKLNNNTFLTLQEQKNTIFLFFEVLDLVENVSDKTEESAAKLESIKNSISTEKSVENIIENMVYKYTFLAKF